MFAKFFLGYRWHSLGVGPAEIDKNGLSVAICCTVSTSTLLAKHIEPLADAVAR
jgi:hypothetical protein